MADASLVFSGCAPCCSIHLRDIGQGAARVAGLKLIALSQSGFTLYSLAMAIVLYTRISRLVTLMAVGTKPPGGR